MPYHVPNVLGKTVTSAELHGAPGAEPALAGEALTLEKLVLVFTDKSRLELFVGKHKVSDKTYSCQCWNYIPAKPSGDLDRDVLQDTLPP